MICERCGQRFDRNINRWKGKHRSRVKNCPECRMIIRKECAMKRDSPLVEDMKKKGWKFEVIK